jgi:hypothetical protein
MDFVFSKLISDRKVQQTGTIVQVFDNRELDLDIQLSDGRWEILCVDHGYVMGFTTRADAMVFSAQPVEWCEQCLRDRIG